MFALQGTATAAGRSSSSRFAIAASAEQVLLAASVYWALSANRLFFGTALHSHAAADPATWIFLGALAVAVVAVHFVLLAVLAHGPILKPVLAVLIVATALATHFMQAYGICLDPTMLRNVLRTDAAESRELMSWSLLGHLVLYAGLPLALLWRVRIVPRPWRRAAMVRTTALLASALVAVAAVFAVFQPFASLMRNHKEARYLVTPANYLWSLASVAAASARGAAAPRQAIGLDAAPGATWQSDPRPRVVILVVGETARATNWGLNGYARQTTPELARLAVIDFAQVTSCGTSTEVSLPCMFAPMGRRHYDEARIRGSESLLHVLARAGVDVRWRDNQSGCKGVCDGLPYETVASLHPPGLCDGERCLDEGLLEGLDETLATARGSQLRVLHQLGNHGPAYFRRYPQAFARFQPACGQDELQRCTQQEIVNAYDNALLYTDHVLARLITTLKAHADTVDTALVYVSDHGESLGESNLYLHGMPYAVAPDVQTRVPMVMWMSDGFARRAAVDTGCLRRRAAQPASHDHLFHTVLGLMDVGTSLYEPAWDLASGCRHAAAG